MNTLSAEDIRALLVIALPLINPSLDVQDINDATVSWVLSKIHEEKFNLVKKHSADIEPMEFGAHKGKAISDVYASAPSYLKWYANQTQYGNTEQRQKVWSMLQQLELSDVKDHNVFKKRKAATDASTEIGICGTV